MHKLFVEANDLTNPIWWGYRNIAPMALWDAEPWVWDEVNKTSIAEVLTLAVPGMRALKIPWGGDSRLPERFSTQQFLKCASYVKELFPLETQPLDAFLLDDENNPKSQLRFDRLNLMAGPVLDLAKISCNFNDALQGSGWFGKFQGRTIGNFSNVQAYEASDTKAMKRLMESIRLNAPAVVPHLPICERQTSEGWMPEYDTPNIYSRTRQLIYYAASLGVCVFFLAEYMLNNQESKEKMCEFISRCLSDCDRLYPEEPA